MRQVAIVGGARTRNQAPFTDTTWEIWAFSSLRLHTPRITRWFEMHAPGDLQSQLRTSTRKRHSYAEYTQFLRSLECPIYMQQADETLVHSVTYPLEEAINEFGRVFTSTVSYMIALAIMEGYHTIGVWGVHLTERTVYARQRPAVENLLGIARQRGIHVYLPPGCPLRVPVRPKLSTTDVLYGYDWTSPKAWWRRGRIRKRVR